MKLFSTILFILFSYQSAYSQLLRDSPEKTEKEVTEEILQQLFNTREAKEFALATEAAKKSGVSRQVILEATFLYHIDLGEFDKIVALTEQFKQMLPNFDPKLSKIFSTKEDWLSVIEYGHALKALDEKNIPLFKKHIQEAFWLSPDKASAFAPHINQLHTRKAMEQVQLQLDQEIFQVDDEKPITIAELLEKKQALVLRFWSPWSQQVETYFPLTKNLAEQCNKNKISFASILINQEPQGIKDTLEIIDEVGKNFPSYWLADENNSSLTKLLRVTDLPTIVVISKEGKILYNGTLDNKKLWDILSKVDPKMKIK